MNKKSVLKLINIISIMIISLSIVQIANATRSGGGFPWQNRPSGSRQLLRIPYTTMYADYYKNIITYSANDWTNTATPLYLSHTDDYYISKIDTYIDTGVTDSWGKEAFAITTYNTNNPTRTYSWANITINDDYWWAQTSKIISHEMGHAFGLDHTGCNWRTTSCWFSIMYAGGLDPGEGYNMFFTTSPTQYDINEINLIYPGW